MKTIEFPFLLKEKWLLLASFLLPVIIYLNAIPNGYNLDDELVTRNHPLTSKGIIAIPKIFASPYYQDEQGYYYGYRPVVLTSYAIEHTLFGEHPHIGHAINVLLYGLVCVVLFLTIASLTGSGNYLVPLLTTVIFAIHPLHTEVVCSLKNRDEILALLFGLSSLYAALRHARVNRPWLMVLSIILYTAGILSKQSIFSFSMLIPMFLILFRDVSLTLVVGYGFLFTLPTIPVIPNINLEKQLFYAGGIISVPVVFYFIYHWQRARKIMQPLFGKLTATAARTGEHFSSLVLSLSRGAERLIHNQYLWPGIVILAIWMGFYLNQIFWFYGAVIIWGVGLSLSLPANMHWLFMFSPLLVLVMPVEWKSEGMILLMLYWLWAIGFFGNRMKKTLWFTAAILLVALAVHPFITPRAYTVLACVLTALFWMNLLKWKSIHLPAISIVSVIPALYLGTEVVWQWWASAAAFVLVYGAAVLYNYLYRKKKFKKDLRYPVLLWITLLGGLLYGSFFDVLPVRILIGLPVMMLALFELRNKPGRNHWLFFVPLALCVLAAVKLPYDFKGAILLGIIALTGYCMYQRWQFKWYGLIFWLLLAGYMYLDARWMHFPTEINIERAFIQQGGFDTVNAHQATGYLKSQFAPSPISLNRSSRPMEFVENPIQWNTPLTYKLGTSMHALGVYLQKMFLPHPLLFYYGYRKIDLVSLFDLKSLLIALVHLALLFTAILTAWRQPLISAGLWMYLLSILLFSNLLTPVPGIVGERLAFTASAGMALVLGALLATGCRQKQKSFRIPMTNVIIFALLFLAFTPRTFLRNSDWKDPLTLMSHDIIYLKNSAQANNIYALHLMQAYNETGNKQFVISAVKHFRQALEVYPHIFNVWYDLGRAYLIMGEKDKALEAFIRATEIKQDVAEPFLNAGLLLEEKGDYEKAAFYLSKALELNPQNLGIYTTLSFVYFKMGDYTKSIEINKLAAQRFPGAFQPLVNLGKTYLQLNDLQEAARYFEKALLLQPGNQNIRATLDAINRQLQQE